MEKTPQGKTWIATETMHRIAVVTMPIIIVWFVKLSRDIGAFASTRTAAVAGTLMRC
jgi:hypothetical protein